MPHFLVDDGFAFHHKTVGAGNAAVGLWTRAGAWCRQQLSDGFIPTNIVRTLGSAKEARALVACGLWVEVDGGYQFHEWEQRQTTKAEVLAKREAARERMERARSSRVRANNSRTSREVRLTPSPSPSPSQELANASSGGADQPPAGRARQMPDEFRPSDKHLALAEELGVDLRAEWPQFVDHHRSRGSTMKDWDAALRTWIRNARKFNRGAPAANGSTRPPLVLPTPPAEIADDPARYQEWLAEQNRLHRERYP